MKIDWPLGPTTLFVGAYDPLHASGGGGAAPAECAVPRQDFIGDGWCDDVSPYNSAACGWDGGDCCNLAVVNHACRDPVHANFGTRAAAAAAAAAANGEAVLWPRNPRYSAAPRQLALKSVTYGQGTPVHTTRFRST